MLQSKVCKTVRDPHKTRTKEVIFNKAHELCISIYNEMLKKVIATLVDSEWISTEAYGHSIQFYL